MRDISEPTPWRNSGPSAAFETKEITVRAVAIIADAPTEADIRGDADDLAIPEQRQIRCYVGASGDVVVSQNNWSDDDLIVLIRPENVPGLAIRLLKVAGYGDCEIARRVGAFAYEDVVPGDPPSGDRK